MISGAHAIIYSANPEADRAFLRDALGLAHVDVGHGWLIFGLPPAELAVHPGERNDHHEQYLICEDVQAFVADMAKRQVACSPVQDQRWGLLTQVTLPGGGKLGVYQPRHARPAATPSGATGAPAGYPAVSPYLVVNSVATLLAFASQAYDAQEIRRDTEPDGRIRHAELRIRDAVIMAGERPGAPASPAFLHLYVPDVDETYRRALQAGATSVVAPREQDYGDRTAGVRDPTGTTWWLGTHRRPGT